MSLTWSCTAGWGSWRRVELFLLVIPARGEQSLTLRHVRRSVVCANGIGMISLQRFKERHFVGCAAASYRGNFARNHIGNRTDHLESSEPRRLAKGAARQIILKLGRMTCFAFLPQGGLKQDRVRGPLTTVVLFILSKNASPAKQPWELTIMFPPSSEFLYISKVGRPSPGTRSTVATTRLILPPLLAHP